MILSVSHIGEHLIAEMFNMSQEVRHLIFSRLTFHEADHSEAIPEVPLHYDSHCGNFRFDGAHKIDVAILMQESKICIPVEAKLGKNRLSASTFNKRFLNTCGMSHENTAIKGNMASIHEGKLPESIDRRSIFVKHGDRNYKLHDKWILVVSRQNFDNWNNHGRPSLSNCEIIDIETIIKEYGSAEQFNVLVDELIRGDYYNEWFMDKTMIDENWDNVKYKH